jgi:hypothetical protein
VIVEIVAARETFSTQRDLTRSARAAMYGGHVSAKMLDAREASGRA